jgi:GNAT superfamily N-acetyltransferase
VIRPATPDDYDAFVRLFAEFGIPDPVPTRERFVETMTPQIRVAVREGAVVGFCSWRPYGTLVHVVQLAVDPAMRGQRIGEQLLLDVRALALTAGCTRWYLNVKRDNTSAIKLYERVGFRRELESVSLVIPWSCVPPHEVTGGLAEPADDPVIAERFAVPPERIAMFRAKSTRGLFHLVLLREAAQLAGFAAFDPEFPGAAVFRTARPELGVDLLAQMRAYALPAFDFVRVAVEGDPALAAALVALGAEVAFEMLRLSGPL